MIQAPSLIDPLKIRGYSLYTGVPCSFLKPFINAVIEDSSIRYIGAASEGEAVGISLGAFLAGQKSVTMCQNSGLGNMVNPLTSLNYPFRIPTLLIVTWRGQPGLPDEPQHEQMGQITSALLDTMEIPWAILPQAEEEIEPAIAKADTYMQEHQKPYALIMPKGSVAPRELTSHKEVALNRGEVTDFPAYGSRMTRTEAIALILDHQSGEEVIVATTGKTGRELYTLCDRELHLYVVGGMGTAGAIGLGIASTLPTQPVIVLDGDGALLMKMGALATIGYYQPPNLLHIVLDNEQHDSTGGQATSSSVVQFADIAIAANYRHACFVGDRQGMIKALQLLQSQPGPSLLHVKIKPGSLADLGRPKIKPHEVKERLMHYLSQRA